MTLKLISSGQSQLGSGATVDQYLDDEGNEWTSIGGRDPVMTRTAQQIERIARLRRLGEALRRRDEATNQQDREK